MNANQWSLKAKLIAAFGFLAAMVLVVAALAVTSLQASQERFKNYVDGIDARKQTVLALRGAVFRRAIAARNLVLSSKDTEVAEEKQAVQAAHQDVQTNLQKVVSLVKSQEGLHEKEKQHVDTLSRIETQYSAVALNIVAMTLEGKKDLATTSINDDCRPLLKSLVSEVQAYVDELNAATQQAIENNQQAYAFQRNLLLVIFLLACSAAGVAGFLITRGLMRSLGAEPADLGAAAKQVAEGNLGPVPGAEHAPAGSVLASLGAMQASLATIVSQVRNASDSIATGSAQIAAGNADLSQRTEEQASNLQETAASMEQLTGTVKNNADTASQADQLASSASMAAAKGGEVVDQVVSTMQDIAASSKKISDIIGVIDGIAFQTNILALNAAVEAARAGEQGRGFAVVAGEVRTLAQRSANAAKEIKALIVDSVDKVEVGTKQVHDAGESMAAIVSQVKNVSDLIAEISRATVEQSNGIGQVSSAVNQLDQVTQQNAALVEESAAAADSLRQQADKMLKLVSAFKLNGFQALADSTQTHVAASHAATKVVKPAAAHATSGAQDSTRTASVPAAKATHKAATAPATAKSYKSPNPAAAVGAESASSSKDDDGDWDTF